MTVTTELRRCNQSLERVAQALELILFHHYKVRTGHLRREIRGADLGKKSGCVRVKAGQDLRPAGDDAFRQKLVELASVLAHRSQTEASKHWYFLRHTN